MNLNMDDARRREAKERCKAWFASHHTDLPDALADIDTLLARLRGLLLVIENYTKVHAPPPVVQIEIERARELLDEAHD